MKAPLALAGVVLIGSSLAACGGGDAGGGDYCTELKASVSDIDKVSTGDVESFDQAFSAFHQLADSAPEAVRADWKVLEDAVGGLEQALKDAGVKISDFPTIQAGKLPEGVDATQLSAVATAYAKVADEKFAAATKNVQTHAKQACDVTVK